MVKVEVEYSAAQMHPICALSKKNVRIQTGVSLYVNPF